MYKIVKTFPNDLMFEESIPCISLYQPTSRYLPENRRDPLVFKNLIREIEDSLVKKYKKTDLDIIMEPFYQLERDEFFWNNTLDGLAIFANPGKCILYKLFRPVQELAIVADSFHIKPMIRIFQLLDKYHLLCLSGKDFTLFEGNRYECNEIRMDPGTKRTIEEVLGEQRTDSYLTFGSYGGAGQTAMYHGHGGKKADIDKDIEKFFRYVDRFVLENYSKQLKLPLILVALKEHHNIYKKISHNPYLIEEGIRGSYDSFKTEQLKEKSWEIMEPLYFEKIQSLVNSYENAKASALGSDDLKKIASAAFEGRVGTIFIESDRIIPGKIDYGTGKIQLGDIKDPALDDILDDLAELVLKKRGEVIILPKERIPGSSGAAAIYRY